MRSESPKHLSHGRQEEWITTGVLLDSSIAQDGLLDFSAIFGNRRPVELEIGVGKGTFLATRASARPEVNFLGIEWSKSYAHYTADRFRRAGLPNVRMLHADAGPFVKKCIPAASLWRVHIYFPDPWPKVRHHKRRLIGSPFLAQLRRVVKIGGQVLIMTDHREYFQHMLGVFLGAEGFAKIDFPLMTDREGLAVGTNFEQKYIAQGRPFYKLARLRV